ncbi:catalase [Candidatus Methylobacter oryzae]|uniref:Catalase n=1 Tax=Candidatus Methylobacter oryzae TaxID=2497749 RepID=A0ABY3C6P1_9GAMM|nr:catalase [Candidatus Methylobacter oryzae]TRW91258.1 catalase [Candidatus Methylobacter oryzae]
MATPNDDKPATTGLEPSPADANRSEQSAAVLAQEPGEILTTNQGLLISDNQNSLRGGARGPTLLEDHILREKIMHFDHERIPERVVHARGSGAHGVFEVYESMSRYTKADFLQDPGTKTPVFVRFSTVVGSRGSADTARDVRGFAVKFYTDEGNFDLVGNNIPVFFIQDAVKFPDLVHAIKPEPHHEIPQASSAHDTFWDFISLMPESAHMIMWLMSDRAIPRSYAMMEGFGVHTFRFINDLGESSFVKFHWKPVLGVHSLVWDEAVKLAGKDPDFHRRDLWESINRGQYPEWELGVQIVTEEDEGQFDFDLLDATKLIPELMVPVQIVGKLTLNRNPDNFFAETEQVAFHPGNIVPGIDFSNDPLLQGRLFSYTDTQLSRLGSPNFHEIPINCPIASVDNNQRDGHMRQTIVKGRVSYEPNSLGSGYPMQQPEEYGGFASYPQALEGEKIRVRSNSFADHFSQAALFWRSQSAREKDHIVSAFCFELGKVEVDAVRERVVSMLTQIDKFLAYRVAEGLGMAVPPPAGGAKSVLSDDQLDIDPSLSMSDTRKDSIIGRKVAVLIADGVDEASIDTVSKALAAKGATVKLIAPRLGEIKSRKHEFIKVNRSLPTVGSVMFDAVFIPGGQQSSENLCADADAVMFVKEAYKHGKAIAANNDGTLLLEKAARSAGLEHGAFKGPGVITSSSQAVDDEFAENFIAAIAMHRFFERSDMDAIAS